MHQHLPRSRRLSVTSSSSLPHHLTSSTHQDSHDHDNAATSCFPSMLLMIRDDEYQTLSSPFEDDNQEQLFHQHEPSKAAMFEALSNSRERRMSLNNIMQPCANCNKLLCDCLPIMSHACATVSSSSLPSTQITETKDQQLGIMKGGRRRGSIMLEQVQLNERVPLDTPIMLQHVETGMFLQATIDNIAIPPAIVREEHIGMDCLNHHTSHIWMFRASKQSGEHVGDDDFDRLSRVNIVSALDQKIGLGRVNDQITVTNHSSMLCEWDVKVTQGKFFMPLSSEFEATQPSKSHAPVVVLRLVPTLPGLKKGGSASIKSTMSTDEMVVSVNQLSEQQRLALVPVSTNEYATLTLQEEMKDMSDDFNVNAAEQEWSIVKVRYL